MNVPELDKGGAAEEALRTYFLGMGSFVVRGVPFRQHGELISDIDLWIYTRVSAYARQISIVDIKNRKRSRGFERVLWAKGLQAAVKADEAIVATMDPRDALTPFAGRIGIRVLSSQPLQAIVRRFQSGSGRMSNEDLFSLWRTIKLDGRTSLQARMETSLSYLAEGISFGALNNWIDDAVRYFKEAQDRNDPHGPYIRAAYLSAALVALAADYLGRDLALSETEARRDKFKQGLLFGSSADSLGQDYLRFTEAAVTEFVDQSGGAAARIRRGIEDSVSNLKVGGLLDLFTRPAAGRELIDAACALEAAAYAINVPDASTLRSESKSILGGLLDYAGLPRMKSLGSTDVGKPSPPIPSAEPPNDIVEQQPGLPLSTVSSDLQSSDSNLAAKKKKTRKR
jgi:hypothetical protein